MRTSIRRLSAIAVGIVFGFNVIGCGTLDVERTSFPNAAIGAQGQGIFLDDIEEILNDGDLSEAEKREALRDDLGIEDEDLIDALVAS